MALRIWLPLNGSLENKGISDLKVANIQYNVAIDNNGKIGKCYTNSGTTVSTVTPISISSKAFSMSAWVRLNTRRNNWCRAFGVAGDDTYAGLACEHTDGSKIGFHFYKTIDGTNTSIFDIYRTAQVIGEWVHWTMCYDGIKYYIYKNGILLASNNANRSNIKFDMNKLYLFGGSSEKSSQCSLNDVRIYDHCLSPLEVKEISQGLVLHYKLNGFNNGIRNYISNSKPYFYSDSTDVPFKEQLWGRSLTGGATSTNFKNEFLRITAPSTRDNTVQSGIQLQKVQIWAKYPQMENSFPFLETLQTGDKISFSVETKANDFYRIRPYIIIENADGSLTKNFVSSESEGGNYWLYNNSNNLNNWNKYTYTLEITQDFGDKISSNSIIRLLFVFMITTIPNVSTAGVEVNMDVRNLQLELSDTAHNWSPSFEDLGIDTTKIIDSSGYGNDGIQNNISFESNSSRYVLNAKFNGSDSYIKVSENNWMHQGMEELTINVWAKSNDWSRSHLFSCTQTGGFNTENGDSGYWRFPLHVYTNAEKTTTAYARDSKEIKISELSTTDWNMLTFVYTLEGTKTYINGQLHHTYNNTSYGIHFNMNARLFLGCEANTANPSSPYFIGEQSDFRIYTTALSAEDIATLYHTPVQIDNLGEMHGFEFIEKTSNLLNPDLREWSKENNVTCVWNEETKYFDVNTNRVTSNSSRWGIFQNITVKPNTSYLFAVDMMGTGSAMGIAAQDTTTTWPGDKNTAGDAKRYYYILTTTATNTVGRIYLNIKPSINQIAHFKNIYLGEIGEIASIKQNGTFENEDMIEYNENGRITKSGELAGSNFIEK